MDDEEPLCAVCGNAASETCGNCRQVKYCSRECQSQHWKAHKKSCKKAAAAAALAAAAAASQVKPPQESSKADLVPLCGRGYSRWFTEHKSQITKSGPLYIKQPTVGLMNQGNTCYLNAILQCLMHTTLLTYCLGLAYPKPRPEEEMLTEFVHLLREVDEARGSRDYVSADRITALITKTKEFARGQQADAHEAFMHIISQMLSECLVVGDGSGRSVRDAECATAEQLERSSLVGHVFGMDLGQTVQCDSCSYESTTARVEYCCCLSGTLGMTDLELVALQRELRQGHDSSSSCGRSSSQETSAPETTLDKLLEEYMKGEHVDGYKCEKCMRLGCTLTAHFARRPNVLVVYIDRRQDTGLYGKINRRVRFNSRLDLSPWICSPGDASAAECKYSLYAMVVHKDINRSTFCGHYVAYLRDRTSKWYLLNDRHVEQVPWSSVQEQHPYLLLYAADVVLPPQSPAVPPAQLCSQPQLPAPQQEERELEPKRPGLRQEWALEPTPAARGPTPSGTSTRSTAASTASSPRSSSSTSSASTSASGPRSTSARGATVPAADGPPAQVAAKEGRAVKQGAPSCDPTGLPHEEGSEAQSSAREPEEDSEVRAEVILSLEDLLAQLDLEEQEEQQGMAKPDSEDLEEKPPVVQDTSSFFDFDTLDKIEEESASDNKIIR